MKNNNEKSVFLGTRLFKAENGVVETVVVDNVLGTAKNPTLHLSDGVLIHVSALGEPVGFTGCIYSLSEAQCIDTYNYYTQGRKIERRGKSKLWIGTTIYKAFEGKVDKTTVAYMRYDNQARSLFELTNGDLVLVDDLGKMINNIVYSTSKTRAIEINNNYYHDLFEKSINEYEAICTNLTKQLDEADAKLEEVQKTCTNNRIALDLKAKGTIFYIVNNTLRQYDVIDEDELNVYFYDPRLNVGVRVSRTELDKCVVDDDGMVIMPTMNPSVVEKFFLEDGYPSSEVDKLMDKIYESIN